MNRKYKILLLVVILALLFFGIYRSKSSKTEEIVNNSSLETQEVLVEISESGFKPIKLNIAVGTTVVFKNVGEDSYWPASDPHPTHTIYSKLDPKRVLNPGESWSFTFNTIGTWRMHDHENPALRAVIVVTDGSNNSSINTSVNCSEGNTDFNCYENYYLDLVKKESIDAGFKDLREKYQSNSYVQSQCHPLAHVIGHAAVELYPEVSTAFSKGDVFCWSGYYHGVMEGIVADIGEKKIIEELNSICTKVEGKESYSFDYYNCVHGLGHGLMVISDNELFEALDICNTFQGGWEKESCYGGAFMENVIVDNKSHFTKFLKPSDPLYPCNAVDVRYKESCYLMQTSYMLKVVNYDFAKVFPLCRKADKGFENTCFQSLGRDASGQSISDAKRTKAVCDMGANDTEKSNCLIGAVKDFISYYHSDVEAKALCGLYSSDLHQVCLNTTISYYKSF